MNLTEVFRIWRKRWILTTLILLAALLASALAVLQLPRDYQAQSTAVLVPSLKASKALGNGNPYLSFTSSLATTADVVAAQVMGPATERSLAAKGFDEPYTVVSESTISQTVSSGSVLPGPFVVITVSGGNPQSVERTLYGVTAAIRATMRTIQAGLSRKNRISVSTLSFSPQAALSLSTTARSIVLTVGLIIAFALVMPLIVDGQIARRRMRRGVAAPHIPAQQPARTLSRKV
jgi:capsular polysaccharide biosynthesis protein